MKAMILAAGLGTRMRPLTDSLPKPLLQAGGKTLIEHHLLNLAAGGITHIIINHFYLGEKIEQALGDGSAYGVRIQYSPESTRLETAGGIVKALPLLGQDSFIVVNGDIWTDYSFASLQPVDGINTLARLVMIDNPEHNPAGDFNLGANNHLQESATADSHALTFSGISVLHSNFFKDLSEEPRPLAPLLRAAIAIGKVEGEYYTGRWFDIGTPERLRELDAILSTP